MNYFQNCICGDGNLDFFLFIAKRDEGLVDPAKYVDHDSKANDRKLAIPGIIWKLFSISASVCCAVAVEASSANTRKTAHNGEFCRLSKLFSYLYRVRRKIRGHSVLFYC